MNSNIPLKIWVKQPYKRQFKVVLKQHLNLYDNKLLYGKRCKGLKNKFNGDNQNFLNT